VFLFFSSINCFSCSGVLTFAKHHRKNINKNDTLPSLTEKHQVGLFRFLLLCQPRNQGKNFHCYIFLRWFLTNVNTTEQQKLLIYEKIKSTIYWTNRNCSLLVTICRIKHIIQLSFTKCSESFFFHYLYLYTRKHSQNNVIVCLQRGGLSVGKILIGLFIKTE